MKNPFESIKNIKLLQSEQLQSAYKTTKAGAVRVGRVALTVAKYGTVFSGGVLLGTICGVVLFFKISDGDF